MSNSHILATAICLTDGVLDKLILCAPKCATDVQFLSTYKTKLGSGRTNLSEDRHFLRVFVRCWESAMGQA